jgi:hypothetical protein
MAVSPHASLGNIRWKNAELAMGAVAAWGKVVVEPGLVRAQHSRIAVLASPSSEYHERSHGVEHAAKVLGVQTAPFEEIERRARHCGEPLPRELRLERRDLVHLEDLTYRESRTPPTFRFLFKPTGGEIEPWSDHFAKTPSVRGFEDPLAVAVGDIFALDDDNAVAIFERVPSRWRRTAEHELRAWAKEDDWRLAILPGRKPLADPPSSEKIPSKCFRCNSCGDTKWLNWITGPAAFRRGFISSRCEVCRGRKRFVAWKGSS